MRKITYQPRPSTVQTVRRYVASGYDVELLSPRGNGGSRFLRELLDELQESGQHGLLLPALGDERPLPSALVTALHERDRALPAAGAVGPVELAGHIERAFGGRSLTLLADGPQALTPLLLAAVAHLRGSAPVSLVVLTDRETTLIERAPRAVSVPLPLLLLEEVGAVLHGAAGAPIEASALGRIYAKSGGLVKLAVALAEVARIEGRLRREGEWWVAAGELWSPRLAPMVRGAAAAAITDGADDTEALTALAAAGVATADEAAELVGEPALTRLERAGLVSVDSSGAQRWVSVTPPVLGEHLRGSRRPAAAAPEPVVWEDPEPVHPFPELRFERTSPILLRRISERRASEFRAATNAWAQHRSAVSGLRLVEGLAAQRAEPAAIRAAIVAAARAPVPRAPGERGAEHAARARLRVWEARLVAAEDEGLVPAIALLERAEQEATGPDARGLLAAGRIGILADRGTLSERAEAQLAACRAAATPAVRGELQLALAELQLLRGHVDAAGETLRTVPQPQEGEWALAPEAQALSARIALEQGEGARAQRLALTGFTAARDRLDEARMRLFGAVLGFLLVVRGQSVGIARLSEMGAALGGPPLSPRGADLGIRVCGIVAALGTAEELRPFVAALERRSLPAAALPGAAPAWAAAQLAAREHDRAEAAQLCWAEAIELRRRGALLAAAHGALRGLGHEFDEQRAATLEGWLRGIGSVLLDARFAALRACAREDANAALDALPGAIATGQYGVAGETLRALARFPSVRDETELAARVARARRDFDELLARAPGGMPPAGRGPALTPREEEVARLVAAGLSNRQIQEELVLSIRTVENHVHRLMRKLRLGSRAEVGDAVHEWGQGSPAESAPVNAEGRA